MKLFAIIATSLAVSIIWAVAMLSAAITLLLYVLNDFNASYLPYVGGFVLVWFGAVALSGAISRMNFNYGTVHGSAA